MSMDDVTFWLGVSQVTVGALAVAVVFVGYWEFVKVRELRDDLTRFKSEMERRLFASQKAQQRIVASYGVKDADQQIALIRSAIEADPSCFNAYNALGYALWFGKQDIQAALAAFQQATVIHPEAKEGWFDLAAAYLEIKRFDLARDAIARAVAADPSARADALADARFAGFVD